jgi:mono/diheme cytochrome c family protein
MVLKVVDRSWLSVTAERNGGIMARWKKGLLGLAAVLVVIQVVPYGHAHANPSVVSEPAWDSEQTRGLAVAACFDCHSNETVWPWYTNVAPISWLAQHDVDEGRRVLNFSEWDRNYRGTDEAAESVREGEMPPLYYGWIHSDARLDADQVDQLVAGLNATLGSR